jgi:hypothetical protein
MKVGGIPMALKARTGLLTPPGMSSMAFWYSWSDFFLFIFFPPRVCKIRSLSRKTFHTKNIIVSPFPLPLNFGREEWPPSNLRPPYFVAPGPEEAYDALTTI